MGNYAVAEPQVVSLLSMSTRPFPVRRIYCVGRNYADHVKEMGGDPAKDQPFFFMKPADAILQNGETMPYPPGTNDLQPEVELVVAMNIGGKNIPPEKVNDMIFGYAVGLDMTKRDVQNEARKRAGPGRWRNPSTSRPLLLDHAGNVHGRRRQGQNPDEGEWQLRQNADLGDMIWGVPEIVALALADRRNRRPAI